MNVVTKAASVRVLVVDDSDELRQTLVLALGALRYVTYAAANSEEALACVAASGGVDVLITDLVMGGRHGRGGVELARRLTAQHPNLGVLFVSGHASLVGRLVSGGALRYRFLEKPFTLAEISREIALLLDS